VIDCCAAKISCDFEAEATGGSEAVVMGMVVINESIGKLRTWTTGQLNIDGDREVVSSSSRRSQTRSPQWTHTANLATEAFEMSLIL